jgi:hypothetical protein
MNPPAIIILSEQSVAIAAGAMGVYTTLMKITDSNEF